MKNIEEKKEYKISWVKVLCCGLGIVLIALLIYLIYPKKDKSEILKVYNANLNIMKEAGFEYFKGDNLPSKVGEVKKLTLDEMIKANLVEEILDEKGKACSREKSYLEVTKKNDQEYTLKVALDCPNKSDYIVTTITDYKTNDITYVAGCKCVGNTCTNCQTPVYHSVNFEVNGGVKITKKLVEHGELLEEYQTYKKGYKFLGWYTDKGFKNKYDFKEPVITKMTLYAKWSKE